MNNTIKVADLKPGQWIKNLNGHAFEVLEVTPGQWANRDAKPSADGTGKSIAERNGDGPDFFTLVLDSHREPFTVLQRRVETHSVMNPVFEFELLSGQALLNAWSK